MSNEFRFLALELAERALEFAIGTLFKVFNHVAHCSSGAAKIRTLLGHGSNHPAGENGRCHLEIVLATHGTLLLPQIADTSFAHQGMAIITLYCVLGNL